MQFHEALDALFGDIDQRDIAKALDTSASTIRVIRTRSKQGNTKAGPVGWEDVVLALGRRRLSELQSFVTKLKSKHRAAARRRKKFLDTSNV